MEFERELNFSEEMEDSQKNTLLHVSALDTFSQQEICMEPRFMKSYNSEDESRSSKNAKNSSGVKRHQMKGVILPLDSLLGGYDDKKTGKNQGSTPDDASDSSSTYRAKTYVCPVCQKMFLWRCYLKRHLRTHASVKCYRCKVCEFRTTDCRALHEHMLLHLSEGRHECSLRGLAFSDRQTLIGHVRHVHGCTQPASLGERASQADKK